jgi:proline iminopeptidase
MPREAHVMMRNADLYIREIGNGPPIIVVHGGPDFDHNYLLPEMDRFADSYRLIYYDQRGRGASANGVQPEDVTMESEVEDLDGIRKHFQLESVAILGHSFGAVLALEYAIRHPDRVSSLILMNPAPASHADFLLLRSERLRKWPDDVAKLKELSATEAYREGDPDAVAAYYRVHFKAALSRPEYVEKVVASLRASFTREGILKARRIEARLNEETWLRDDYDLLPKLAALRIPTLVIGGDHEFIPEECATHIAQAIPNARRVTLQDCGHFSYLECPDQVRKELDAFFKGR